MRFNDRKRVWNAFYMDPNTFITMKINFKINLLQSYTKTTSSNNWFARFRNKVEEIKIIEKN